VSAAGKADAADLSSATGFEWPAQPLTEVLVMLAKIKKQKNPAAGIPRATLVNLKRVLQLDARIGKRILRDEFADVIWVGEVELFDSLEFEISVWLASVYKLFVSPAQVHTVLIAHAFRNGFDPLKEYLTEVEWDGEARIETALTDFLSVEDTPLNRQLSRLFFIGAAARGLEPACKLDTVLNLVGLKGLGKSKSLAALCPNPRWFSDTQIDLNSKDRFQDIQGVWLHEFSELDSMSRAGMARVKGFVTSQWDRYRPSYGRNSVNRPRRTVFVGSTNERMFLSDDAGNRRFWPVVVGECRWRQLEDLRDQLWAEAVVAVRAGVEWYLSPEYAQQLTVVSEDFRPVDSWEERIVGWLRREPKPFRVTDMLLDILGKDARIARADENRAGKVLVRLGFESRSRTWNGEIRHRRWVWTGKGSAGPVDQAPWERVNVSDDERTRPRRPSPPLRTKA